MIGDAANVIDGKDDASDSGSNGGPQMVTTDPESLKKAGVIESA